MIKLKLFIIGLSLCFFQSIYSQKKKEYSCDEIKNIIVDANLFDTLPNGKLISRVDRIKSEVYKVIIDKKVSYLISKKVYYDVKNSIKKNKCKNIKIKKLRKTNVSKLNIVRD